MTRQVLILAYDFPPRGTTSVFRVTKFVRYLPEFGWQPVVVAAAVQGGFRDEALLAQLPANVEIIRVANHFAPSGGGAAAHTSTPSLRARLRRQLRHLMIPDAQMLWVPAAVRAATQRLARGDISALMTTAPPYSIHMAGLWLKRRFPELPWLMDLRDIWSENPAITDLLTYKFQRACEALCLRHADHVTTATDGQRMLVQRSFNVSAARLSTITNGFDSADVPVAAPREAGAQGALQLTYVGSIIGTRAAAAEGLFAALRRLAASGYTGVDLEVRLIGVFAPVIYEWAQPFTANGMVRLIPFMPQADAYASMAAADTLLLVASDDREGRLSHPNKLFEYFAVRRPVLALVPEGDVSRLVREANVGEAIPPRDVDRIEAALRRMVADRRAGVRPNVPTEVARFARFERRELARQLAARLDGLVSS